MSSFLDQFDNDDFNKEIKKEPKVAKKKVIEVVEDKKSSNNVEVANEIIKENNVAEVIDLVDTRLNEKTITKNILENNDKKEPERKKQSLGILEESTDDDLEVIDEDNTLFIDPNFKKKQKKKRIKIGILVGVILVALIVILVLMNLVNVTKLEGKKLDEAMIWAKEKNINLVIEKKYSTTKDEHVILKQSVKENSKVFKGKTITIQVSQGADPEEKITLIDFTKSSLQEVQDWIEKNKLFGINLELEYSDTVEKNKFIKKEFSNELISETNYKRSDSLKVVYSKGVKPIVKNIEVESFIKKDRMEAEAWATKVKVVATFNEAIDDNIPQGKIVSQTIAAKEKMAEGEEIIFVVSKGKGVKIPNYGLYTIENASGASSEVSVTVRTRYSYGLYGDLISQSLYAGTVVSQDEAKVEVIYSEGRPFVKSLDGMSRKDVEQYEGEMNSKGANITFVFEAAAPREGIAPGTAVDASVKNNYVDFNSVVYVYFTP